MICKKLQECIDGQLAGISLAECDNRNQSVCI